MIKELLINYLYYLKIKDYEMANKYQKALNKNGVDDQTIQYLIFGEENKKETKAICYVISYYLNNTDIEGLHENLYELFGSYKEAVTWFADNDNLIKSVVYGIKS